MIGNGTNVPMRYLVGDAATHAQYARQLFKSLIATRPGFIC